MQMLQHVCGSQRAVLDVDPNVRQELLFLWLCMLGWLASELPGVLATGALALWYALLHLDSRDLNSSPHDCTPSTLSIEPSP